MIARANGKPTSASSESHQATYAATSPISAIAKLGTSVDFMITTIANPIRL